MREFDTGATREYHGHPKFYEILTRMADLHSQKNHDYSGDDPLSNLRASEEIGIPAWKSIIVRLMDKWSRIKNFVKEGNFEVKDESVIDTLMDNAIYSILCIIMLEEKKESQSTQEFMDKKVTLLYDYKDPPKTGTCAPSTPLEPCPQQYGDDQ